MSAVNRILSREAHLRDLAYPPSAIEDGQSFVEIQEVPNDPFITIWTKVSQAILPIVIWMILGFAAGFLIGMIRPR
jgi:hypothetical protein